MSLILLAPGTPKPIKSSFKCLVDPCHAMKRFQVESDSYSSESESAGPGPPEKRQRPQSSSSSESSRSTCSKQEVGKCELLLTQLSMFDGEATDDPSSCASTNGQSRERIVKLFKGKICSCAQNCKQRLTINMVHAVCVLFWRLNKAAQDCVLWGIQSMQQPNVVGNDDESSESESGSSSEYSSSRNCTSSSSSCSSTNPRVLKKWFIQGSQLKCGSTPNLDRH